MSLRTDIIGLLRSASCQRINFTIDRTRIAGSDYGLIAQCVERRTIHVVCTAVGGSRAGYNRNYNCFLVGPAPSANLVVHEATHAVNDWYRRSLVDVEDEVLAYIAQMLFTLAGNATVAAGAQQPVVRQRARQFAQQCRVDAGICNTAAIAEATVIASDLLAGGPVNAEALAGLRDSLQRDANTHTDPTNPQRVYDGIRRTTVPEAYLQQVQGTLVTD